jgi:hypothetical protein
MTITRKVSPKEIAANREKSRKLTGPRPAAGRRWAGRNALRHGFYSKELALSDLEKAEFESMRASLFEQLAPTTPLQNVAVDQIVACIWRSKLAMRLETRRLAAYSEPISEPQAACGEQHSETTGERNPSRELTRSKIRFLGKLRADVQEYGLLHEDGWKDDVLKYFGTDFYQNITAWKHMSINAIYMAIMLDAKNKNFQTPLPPDLQLPKDKEVIEDPQLKLQMVLKLIDLEARHSNELLLNSEESDRALRPAPIESIARHFAAATSDLRLAVDWFRHLRAERM